MTTKTNYREQGARAFKSGLARKECRFKAADIVREWQAGWDAASAAREEAQRKAAVPRWQEYGSRGFGKDATPPTEYYLKGDAPQITVHHDRYAEEKTEWFVSCHEYGIEREPLHTTDAVTAKRQAILRVREILLHRRSALLAISDPETGDLVEVQS
jgi:hypothetical protein